MEIRHTKEKALNLISELGQKITSAIKKKSP